MEIIKKTKFSNGKPFTNALVVAIKSLKKRVEDGKASLVIIDGIMGEGKTTLAVEVLEEYQGSAIDYDIQYAMGFQEFSKKFRKAVKTGVKAIIYDEAGDFNRRGWASTINKHLNRIFETYRKFGILIIMVQPSFYKFDSDMLVTGTPRLLLHCHSRSQTFGKFKGYGLWRMSFIKQRMEDRRLASKNEAYRFVTPNFYGLFYDLPEQRALKLDKISTQGKSEILEEIEIESSGLMDYVQLAQYLDRSVIWVKNKVSEMNLKPDKTHKRKKYFSKEIAWTLREKLFAPGEKKGDGDGECK